MQKMLTVLIVTLSVAACGKDKLPAAPTAAELAVTPSTQAEVMSIKIEKEPQPNTSTGTQMRVTLGENFNRGLADDKAISDWNGAKISLVKRCNDRESQVIKDMQSGDIDPVTRKSILVFTQVDTCNGDPNFRLRVTPYGSNTPINFTFPRGVHWLSQGYRLVRDGEFYYIRGTVQ